LQASEFDLSSRFDVLVRSARLLQCCDFDGYEYSFATRAGSFQSGSRRFNAHPSSSVPSWIAFRLDVRCISTYASIAVLNLPLIVVGNPRTGYAFPCLAPTKNAF
jgi:hypothetical protein